MGVSESRIYRIKGLHGLQCFNELNNLKLRRSYSPLEWRRGVYFSPPTLKAFFLSLGYILN